MGQFETLRSKDGFALPAYTAEPGKAATCGIVVIQEIFGLTDHICDVVDRLAGAGFATTAPDLFARSGAARPISYDNPQAGLAAVGLTQRDEVDHDLDAACQRVNAMGVIGFCWGGGEAWRLGLRAGLPAAVCFYPTRMAEHLPAAPHGEVLVQIAKGDRHTPDTIMDEMKAAKPDMDVHAYDAIHGFMSAQRAGFDAVIAEKAWGRALDVFNALGE